jgi:uncharacterized protein YbjT (DUF2867 family)
VFVPCEVGGAARPGAWTGQAAILHSGSAAHSSRYARLRVILLTGATGTVGRALLGRLTAADRPVRCLVRDPRRLGPERMNVQLVMGDLADAGAFRNALRGVDTVIHLAASIRDQPAGSIEELNGLATARLVRAAERAGCERFVFFSALGATPRSRTRFMRSKALATTAVERAAMPSTVFSPSIVYAPGDPWLTLLDRLSLLPVVPISGGGEAAFQPIWADDVARCVMADLDAPPRNAAYSLTGPERMTYDQLVDVALTASDRRRPPVHVPLPVVRAGLRALERVAGPAAFATWEEAALMEESM